MSGPRYAVDSPWPVEELNERIDAAGKQKAELEARKKAMELAAYMGEGWKAKVFYSPLMESWSWSAQRGTVEVRTSLVRLGKSDLETLSAPFGVLFTAWFNHPDHPGTGFVWSGRSDWFMPTHPDPKEALRLGTEACREAIRDKVEALNSATRFIDEWDEEKRCPPPAPIATTPSTAPGTTSWSSFIESALSLFRRR